MPVFTAAAAAIVGTTALTGIGATIATSVIASGLAYGTGHLLGVFDDPGGSQSFTDQGVDVRLAPSTQNRLPILLGQFQQRGLVVYFEVSEDRQNLHTVVALGEGPITSIDEIYWEDLLLTLDANGVVTNATDRDGVSVDRLNGLVTVQTYLGGSTGNNSTYLEGLSTLWTSSHKMTNIAYAVVSVKYDRENEVTGLGDMRFIGTGVNDNPSDVVKDLFENPRYGLELDSSLIDSSSFQAAADYYDEMITYSDTDGVDRMQKRHRVNGVLNTGDTVLQRIETVLNGCNSSLRWSNGRWGIFVNKQESATTFEFNDNNIIGNVSIVETGLNNLFNRIEVQYGRNADNNWQRATAFVESPASVRYPNELDRTMSLNLPLINTSVEAKAAATVILNQGRQQLTVKHNADATAMPLEAGDVVRYTKSELGWSGKLFRIVEVTEMESRGALEYSITAVEYADAVYDYGVLNEDDVAPNVPIVDIATIEAVNDLAVSGLFPNRSTPAIQLTWTVPSNSLIETFDVFYSVGGTQFNSPTTVFAKSVVSTAGTFVPDATVVEDITSIPTGNISLWVVGRNDFSRSAESNTVTVANYQPGPVTAGETVYRFNETPSVISGVNQDVGAPPANATGVGTGRNNNANDTGWYESELDASDRENAPVWTAVSTVVPTGGEPRELDFAFSGTSGDIIITDTPTNQIIDFELAGTIGDRELQYPARPEMTLFTFSGQAAEADDADPGVEEVWQIDVTGSTDAGAVATNEEFYLLPAGTSDTFTGEQFIFTPDNGTTGTGATLPDILLDLSNNLLTPGEFRIAIDGANVTDGQVFSNQTTSSGFSEIGGTLNTSTAALRAFLGVASGGGQSVDGGVTVSITDGSGTFTVNNLRTVSTSDSSNFFNFIVVDTLDSTNSAVAFNVDGTFNFGSEFTISVTKADGATITIDGTTVVYELSPNLSGAAAIGADLNTSIGSNYDSDFVKTFDATTGVITLTALDADDYTVSLAVFEGGGGDFEITTTNIEPSGAVTTIQLQVSELTLDQTIELASNVTGQALLDDIETKLLDNIAITNQFTVTQDTATIDGNSVTIVKLVAIPIQNLSLAITINSGITGTTSGTLVEGAVSATATSITLTYDPDILPVTQMLTFGENATSVQVATELTALIDSHGDLEAVQGDTFSSTFQIADTGPTYPTFTDDLSTALKPYVAPPGTGTVLGNNFSSTVNSVVDTGSLYTSVSQRLDGLPSGDILLVGTDSSNFVIYRVGTSGTSPNGRLNINVDYITHVGSSTFTVGTTYNMFYGDDILLFNRQEVVETSFVENLSSSSILVKPDIIGDQTQPVITVNTQGTGDAAFNVSTPLQGRVEITGSPAFTEYVISYDGVELNRSVIASAFNAASAASQITDVINASTELTATRSNSVVTVTSTANSSADTTISLITGVNEPGKTSTNDLAVSRAVTNFGSATDVFAGVDSTITVRVSGEVYYTDSFNATDDTIPIILDALEVGIDAIVPGFDFDERWDGDVEDDSTIRATALATGTDPTITISIAAGSTATVDSIGNITTTPATLNSTATVINSGANTDITSGELSSFTVTQGTDTLISAMDITGNSSASSVASQIALAISANTDTDYTTSASNVSILATLIENNNVPDLTISISPGKDADDTAANLAVMRTVLQEGAVGTIDLTDAVWTYFISSPTVDDDTLMIGDDGTITARRGVVLNSESVGGVTSDYLTTQVDIDTNVVVGNRPVALEIAGACILPALTTTTAGSYISVTIQITTNPTDTNPTYTDVYTTPQFSLVTSAALAGSLVTPSIPIAATVDVDANTTFSLRAVRSDNNPGSGGLYLAALVLEELRAT